MAKARKLPSGAWNVQVYDYTDKDGKRHYQSFTEDTKAQAEYKAALFAKNKQMKQTAKTEMTVGDAVDRYIELSQVLSPTTILGYKRMRKFGFQHLMDVKVKKLSNEVMQEAIIEESKRITPRNKEPISSKTLKNEYGLLSAALREVCGLSFNVKLPKYQKHIKDYPEPALLIQIIKGSSIELPCMLALWLSFSLSEIRGLMCSSVQNGYITINQVLVEMDGQQIRKENAKVETRIRKHKVPEYIMGLIENTENYRLYLEDKVDRPLIDLTGAAIYNRWKKLIKPYGINLSFHDLRHESASIMVALNIPSRYMQERGGWKTDYTMKRVYQHTFTSERELVDAKIDTFMEDMLNDYAE